MAAHASRLVQSVLVKHQITQVTQPAYRQPRLGALWLLAFPKTKITFEREEISDLQWDSGTYDGEADGNWENFVRSEGAYFEGDWGITVLCKVFLVSCIFFHKCLYFSYYMARYLLDRHIHTTHTYTQTYTIFLAPTTELHALKHNLSSQLLKIVIFTLQIRKTKLRI